MKKDKAQSEKKDKAPKGSTAKPAQTAEGDPRTEDEIAADVACKTKELLAMLIQYDKSLKLGELVRTLISEADSGSTVAATQIIHLAMDCTQWLTQRLDANDQSFWK